MKICRILLLAFFAVLTLSSCKTPAQNERLSALVALAIKTAERRGIITEADAADVMAAKVIVIDQNPYPIVTHSGK